MSDFMIYKNLKEYFSDYYYNNSNQIDIFDPYSKYELNRKIIDFDYIPTNLSDEFMHSIISF